MYQILMVDDESIILSGIKFLIDWEENNCVIVGTARNGQEALEKINTLSPDIVFCDIKMPVINGIELLKQVSKERPDIVFVMLTNLEDFELARDALRLHAADYLLKSQLEPDTLKNTLINACNERERRTKLAQVDMVESFLKTNRNQLLKDTFLRILQASQSDNASSDIAPILEDNGVRNGFGAIQIPFDFSAISQYETFSDDEQSRLFAWQTEVTQKVVKNFFEHSIIISPNKSGTSLLVFCWDMPSEEWTEKLPTFTARLMSASTNITQVKPVVLATDYFSSVSKWPECQSQLFKLMDHYYLTDCPEANASDIPNTEYRTLGLSGIAGRLAAEIRTKNIAGCSYILQKAMNNVHKFPHQQSQAIWLCNELYSAASDAIRTIASNIEINSPFFHSAYSHRAIDHLTTRSQVLLWLEALQNNITVVLEQFSGAKSELIEKARQYVRDNVDKRIMLQDVADYICISPGYLSALFKKQYNQNFVEYVNSTKIERACQLIKEDKLMIYEISNTLGFENAYYFTKVFKRLKGMTPTEYQHKMKGGFTDNVE
jgi:two-component system, response regulator YesN